MPKSPSSRTRSRNRVWIDMIYLSKEKLKTSDFQGPPISVQNVTSVLLVDELMDAAAPRSSGKAAAPSRPSPRCGRARMPRPTRRFPSASPHRAPASLPACRAPQDALRDMAESFDIMLSHDVHGHLKMVGSEMCRTPPSGAAQIASYRPPVLRRPCSVTSSRRTCGRSSPTRATRRCSSSTRTPSGGDTG